jgi:hypothetical protein
VKDRTVPSLAKRSLYMIRVKTACLTAALACAGLFSPTAGAETAYLDAADVAALDGTWASPASEDWGQGAFGTRRFTFADGTWTLDFALALDPGMNAKVFEFHTEGTYDVLAPSAAVPGAYEMLFREATKAVTLRATDPGLIQAFGLAGCNLAPDVKTDISASGCAIWKPVAVCSEDHDLLALDSEMNLYFGVRPADNDMCTPEKRPTALLPAVVRQD